MPLISVIVPARNAEATIRDTIASVLRQTFEDFELIVIDDGSTDGTRAVIDRIADDRLRYVSFENAGLAAARNRGIERSNGAFISFIDADDLWTPDKLESQVQVLRSRPAAGLAYSWTAFIDDHGRYLFAKEPQHYEGDVYADLLRQCFIASGSNVLLRRRCVESVGPFHARFPAVEDWEYWLRVAEHWQFAVVRRYQILYRLSTKSMSSDVDAIEASATQLLEHAMQSASASGVSRNECIANLKQYCAFLYMTRASGSDSIARAGRRLGESIRLCPRILLGSRTLRLLCAWFLMRLAPRAAAPRVVRALMRLHGRWMRLRSRGHGEGRLLLPA
jgi:glycosyltransferase involved in cell wall biosynthesis